MMAQFLEIKAVNPGYLLFYRMGDFYEMFFEDAEIAAQALGIVLTKRGKHQGLDIPMCGVPIHAAQDYLKKLIALGHRVAICEQIEDPAEAKKRGAKSPVKRDVVRLVTARHHHRGRPAADARAPTISPLSPCCGTARPISRSPGPMSRPATPPSSTSAIDTLADELARIDPAELLLTDATRAALGRRTHSAAAVDALAIADCRR